MLRRIALCRVRVTNFTGLASGSVRSTTGTDSPSHSVSAHMSTAPEYAAIRSLTVTNTDPYSHRHVVGKSVDGHINTEAFNKSNICQSRSANSGNTITSTCSAVSVTTASSSSNLVLGVGTVVGIHHTPTPSHTKKIHTHSHALMYSTQAEPEIDHSESKRPTLTKVQVLYDGNCPLCLKEISLLCKLNKKKQTLDFVNIALPTYSPKEHNDISYEQAMGVMHVIDTQGKIHTRVAAMYAMYNALGYGWLWSWALLPSMAGVTDRAYMWFARNRHRLTGRDCDSGACDVTQKSKKPS